MYMYCTATHTAPSSQPSSLMDTRLPQPKNLAGRRPTLRERHWAREALDGGLAPKGLSPKILGLAAPQARKF